MNVDQKMMQAISSWSVGDVGATPRAAWLSSVIESWNAATSTGEVPRPSHVFFLDGDTLWFQRATLRVCMGFGIACKQMMEGRRFTSIHDRALHRMQNFLVFLSPSAAMEFVAVCMHPTPAQF